MKKINIVIVDDHKIMRDGIKAILSTDKTFKVVHESENGENLIAYLEKEYKKVNVVLMDISLPSINGIDATSIVLKLFKKINVLALTMHDEEAYIVKMIKAGAKGYILKDASREELINAIKKVALGQNYYSNEVSVTLINAMIKKDENPPLPELTDRESQVIQLICNGNTNNDIAEILSISYRTVETHRRSIIKKLELKNTAELVKYAITNHLVH